MHDQANTWLTGDQEGGQVEFYTSTADVIIVERHRMIKLLGDIFGYHFGQRSGLRVLDLGGGDGIITEYLLNRYPGNTYVLLDGAPGMLEKARRHLDGKDVAFIEQTFEDYLAQDPQDQTYDCIFSSNAIHHLDFLNKSRLFARILRELTFEGLFINMDVILAASERSEQWQLAMWRDWMNETLQKAGFEDDVGIYDDVPQIARAKAENKPSPLVDQLHELSRLGFRNVDCFYKYGVFAVYGGTK